MERFDYVIIGGGVIGAAVAYHLARDAGGSVLLVERNDLASAATSRAAGLVLQSTSSTQKTPLVRLTCEAIRLLEDELDDAVGFHEVGSLRLAASVDTCAELEAIATDAQRHDIPLRWLDEVQARELVPWLDASAARKIAFMPGDGYVDPYRLAMAYVGASRLHGAEIRSRTAVADVLTERGRVIGVRTSAGQIACGCVIDAAGAWAAIVSQRAGYALPMAPVRSHYWITERGMGFGTDHPITVLPDASAYTRPETGGLLLGVQEPHSATFDARDLPDDPDAFSPTTGEDHWDILADGAQAVSRFCPEIMEYRFADYISGLSSYTPDGQPVLGPVPGIEGFLAAAGCCGSGVMLSAGIGAAVTDLALGRQPTFDITAFRPDRFGPVDPFSQEFRARCAKSRANKSR